MRRRAPPLVAGSLEPLGQRPCVRGGLLEGRLVARDVTQRAGAIGLDRTHALVRRHRRHDGANGPRVRGGALPRLG